MVAGLPFLEVAVASNGSAGWSEGWDKKPHGEWRKGAGKQCICTRRSWVITIDKPEQYQKKWTELGFCWAEQEILIFMNTYRAPSIGFLPRLAGRH